MKALSRIHIIVALLRNVIKTEQGAFKLGCDQGGGRC